MTSDAEDKPVWTFFRATSDLFQMIEAYDSPLTRAQIEALK